MLLMVVIAIPVHVHLASRAPTVRLLTFARMLFARMEELQPHQEILAHAAVHHAIRDPSANHISTPVPITHALMVVNALQTAAAATRAHASPVSQVPIVRQVILV